MTALGDDLQAARDKAYAAADEISFPGVRRRSDIGWREIEPPVAPAEAAGEAGA